MSAVTAVAFDLDGTICESTQDEQLLYAAAFDAVDRDPFGEVHELWGALDGPPDPNDEQSYLAAGFRRVGAQYGKRRVPADDLAAGLLGAIDRRAVAFREGAEEALDAACEHGPVAILTNGPARRQRPKVDALSLADSVETVCYAGDMPRRKPHPEPFESVCEALSVPAESTLYVGDSLSYDIAGAHGAGLQAAWCPREPSDRERYQPEFILDSLEELADVLEGAGD